MNTLALAFIALALLASGYRFYGNFAERLFGIDPGRKTPAEEHYDGVDYVPARNWFVLLGHHFASIAGAAPIIGPIIAVSVWGWGPALIWIVLGSILIGGIHDFGALMASVRHQGWSVAEIGGIVVGPRTRVLFSVFIWLTLILVIAVFVYFCAKTYVAQPKVVIPSLGLIPVAIGVGYMLYTLRINQLLTTVIGLALMVALIYLGNAVPIVLSGNHSLQIWMFVLLAYSFMASVVPVQVLLQPRDYLCGIFLVVGIACGFGGLLFSHPNTSLPAFTAWEGSKGALWPMLFVTIACGAISGFHSLVASGTSSKQLPNEKDAKKIGYGGMILEGAVATLALLAVIAGFQKQDDLIALVAAHGPIAAFSQGFQVITEPFFGTYGGVLAITILNSFILSTLDSCTRIERYITHELFGIRNRYSATLIIIILSTLLALSGQWEHIWPIFGAANQMVAALSFLVISTWLMTLHKPMRYTLVPAVLILITTLAALLFQSIKFFSTNNYLLLGISAVLIILAGLVLLEACTVLRGKRT